MSERGEQTNWWKGEVNTEGIWANLGNQKTKQTGTVSFALMLEPAR